MKNAPKPKNFASYAAGYPKDVQKLLKTMRATIKSVVPKGVGEKISYRMPLITLDGRWLVYFAAFERHIGFYPGRSAIVAFKKDISRYKSAAGSVQFPL